jgi:hypothetical protein
MPLLAGGAGFATGGAGFGADFGAGWGIGFGAGAARTAAVCVGAVVVFDAAGGVDEVAAPPPPQAATARAVSGITAALARKVMGLLRVMSFLLRLGRSTVAATSGYRITRRVVLHRKPRSRGARQPTRGYLRRLVTSGAARAAARPVT